VVDASANRRRLSLTPTVAPLTFGTTLEALWSWGRGWSRRGRGRRDGEHGVYWKPVSNVLEVHALTIQVEGAQHLKTVPGRKTDVNDAEWLADLLRLGRLRGSLIPSRDQRELRELVRYRTSLEAVRRRSTASRRC
jgi:hypothetical protein